MIKLSWNQPQQKHTKGLLMQDFSGKYDPHFHKLHPLTYMKRRMSALRLSSDSPSVLWHHQCMCLCLLSVNVKRCPSGISQTGFRRVDSRLGRVWDKTQIADVFGRIWASTSGPKLMNWVGLIQVLRASIRPRLVASELSSVLEVGGGKLPVWAKRCYLGTSWFYGIGTRRPSAVLLTSVGPTRTLFAVLFLFYFP